MNLGAIRYLYFEASMCHDSLTMRASENSFVIVPSTLSIMCWTRAASNRNKRPYTYTRNFAIETNSRPYSTRNAINPKTLNPRCPNPKPKLPHKTGLLVEGKHQRSV